MEHTPYGYWIENGKAVIDEKASEQVRLMYRFYLDGASLCDSAGKAGISVQHGGAARMLCNSHYLGDEYYPALIDRETFEWAKEEMERWANLHSGEKRKKRGYSSKYALSSIAYCPKCGEIYRRIAWNNRGKHSTVWRCCTRVEHGAKECDAPTIQEFVLQNGVAKAIDEVFGNSSAFLPILEENMQAVIGNDVESQLAEIDERFKELQQELLKQANAKQDYTELADEIYALREQRQNVLAAEAEQDGRRQRMEEMKKSLEEQADILLEYDEQLVRRLVEKVTVYEDELVVEFK